MESDTIIPVTAIPFADGLRRHDSAACAENVTSDSGELA